MKLAFARGAHANHRRVRLHHHRYTAFPRLGLLVHQRDVRSQLGDGPRASRILCARRVQHADELNQDDPTEDQP